MTKSSSSKRKPLVESWKFRCEQQWTKYACVVDADESTTPRLEGAGHKPHQDHITAEGMNSLNHYKFVHKFIPMPQDAKAAVEKE